VNQWYSRVSPSRTSTRQRSPDVQPLEFSIKHATALPSVGE